MNIKEVVFFFLTILQASAWIFVEIFIQTFCCLCVNHQLWTWALFVTTGSYLPLFSSKSRDLLLSQSVTCVTCCNLSLIDTAVTHCSTASWQSLTVTVCYTTSTAICTCHCMSLTSTMRDWQYYNMPLPVKVGCYYFLMRS